MENRERHHISLVGPTLLIGIGIILLLNNLGYLDWNVWDVLRLWPVLLVAAGLEILVGRRSLLGSLITAGVVLVLLIGGIWLLQAGPLSRSGEPLVIEEPRNDIERARVHLAPAVGEVYVGALIDSGNFVEGTVHAGRGREISHRFTTDGIPELELKAEPIYGIGVGTSGQAYTWDLRFHPDVTLDLEVDLGAGEVQLELRDMSVDELVADFGAGRVEVTLPTDGRLDVSVNGGIGEIVVYVPRGMAARVRTETALVERTMPPGYRQQDNVFTSPDYEEADHKAEVTLNLAIGRVLVKELKGE